MQRSRKEKQRRGDEEKERIENPAEKRKAEEGEGAGLKEVQRWGKNIVK